MNTSVVSTNRLNCSCNFAGTFAVVLADGILHCLDCLSDISTFKLLLVMTEFYCALNLVMAAGQSAKFSQ